LLRYGVPALQPLLDLGPFKIVTTHRDVLKVLHRDGDFQSGPQVGPDMVCGNFILGTDRGPFFRTDLELMFETFYGTKSTDPIPRFDLPLPPRLEP
jgi:hypothetical protein